MNSTTKLALEVFAASGQLLLSFTPKFAAPSAVLLEVLIMLRCKLSFQSNTVENYSRKGLTSLLCVFCDWLAMFFLNGHSLNNLVYSLALHVIVSVQLRTWCAVLKLFSLHCA